MTGRQQFGQWVRMYRERSNLSQRETAKQAGLRPMQLTRIEGGEKIVLAIEDAATVNRIAVVIGADPAIARLLSGAEAISPNATEIARDIDTLTEGQQKAVRALVRGLMEENRRGGEGE